MAHPDSGRGNGRYDYDEDSSSYAIESTLPPPPVYDDAVGMGMDPSHQYMTEKAQESGEEPEPVSVSVPFSDFKSTWLDPLLTSVKETLERVTTETESMKKSTGNLGRLINKLKAKSYPAMKIISAKGKAFMCNSVVLNEEGQLVVECLNLGLRNNTRRPSAAAQMVRPLHEYLNVVRAWIEEQMELDSDWIDEKGPRLLRVSGFEMKTLNNAMNEIVSLIEKMHDMRHNQGFFKEIEDYVTDLIVKINMEHLWELLNRVVDCTH